MVSLSIKQQIQKLIGEKIVKINPISETHEQSHFIFETYKEKFFVKISFKTTSSFQKEVTGLRQLKTNYKHIPKVIGFSDYFLILSFIPVVDSKFSFWKNLGIQLAELHKIRQKDFGFYEDNFIGRAPQKNKNPNHFDWPDFFWKNRIEHKLNSLFEKNKFQLKKESYLELKNKVYQTLSNHSCHPSIVHGDLWRGNVLCDSKQQAFLIDPAVYYGDREVDLAMTECFGGFSSIFHETYRKVYPLSEGYEKRKHIYNLFHILNHFVIFGDNYKSSAMNLVKKIIDNYAGPV